MTSSWRFQSLSLKLAVLVAMLVSLTIVQLSHVERIMASNGGNPGGFTIIEERGDYVEQYICWFKGSMTLDDANHHVTKLNGTVLSLESKDKKTINMKKTELRDGELLITTKQGAVYAISDLAAASIPRLRLVKAGAKESIRNVKNACEMKFL